MNVVNEILSFTTAGNKKSKTKDSEAVRSQTVTVRLTVKEKEEFFQIMKDRRMNPSEFLRDIILNLEKKQ